MKIKSLFFFMTTGFHSMAMENNSYPYSTSQRDNPMNGWGDQGLTCNSGNSRETTAHTANPLSHFNGIQPMAIYIFDQSNNRGSMIPVNGQNHGNFFNVTVNHYLNPTNPSVINSNTSSSILKQRGKNSDELFQQKHMFSVDDDVTFIDTTVKNEPKKRLNRREKKAQRKQIEAKKRKAIKGM